MIHHKISTCNKQSCFQLNSMIDCFNLFLQHFKMLISMILYFTIAVALFYRPRQQKIIFPLQKSSVVLLALRLKNDLLRRSQNWRGGQRRRTFSPLKRNLVLSTCFLRKSSRWWLARFCICLQSFDFLVDNHTISAMNDFLVMYSFSLVKLFHFYT